MSTNHLRDSLFFRKEMVEKTPELLGVLGVDEHIHSEELLMQDEDEYSQGQSEQWQSVEYHVIKPCKSVPQSFRKTVLQNYQLVKGSTAHFTGELTEATIDVDRLSYHWEIKQEDALVNCYTLFSVEKEGHFFLYQSLSPEFSQKYSFMLKCLDNINSGWEFDGIHITAAYPFQGSWTIVLAIKQQVMKVFIEEDHSENLLIRLKSLIISIELDNLQGKQPSPLQITLSASPQTERQRYATASIEQKIILVYRLQNNLGLTLSLYKDNLSDRLLTRSNQDIYRKSITHLLRLASQYQKFTQEVLALVECHQEEMEKAFEHNLYKKAVALISSQGAIEDFDDLQVL